MLGGVAFEVVDAALAAEDHEAVGLAFGAPDEDGAVAHAAELFIGGDAHLERVVLAGLGGPGGVFFRDGNERAGGLGRGGRGLGVVTRVRGFGIGGEAERGNAQEGGGEEDLVFHGW
ncbi:MAG: hypothetical protein B9S34_02580 [Opitutia bacterium Tous-C1TDCM]|nr:MAG: hypothetical protein B9S34_02580 [Opitutae bacterium Tous-C1TDCM]